MTDTLYATIFPAVFERNLNPALSPKLTIACRLKNNKHSVRILYEGKKDLSQSGYPFRQKLQDGFSFSSRVSNCHHLWNPSATLPPPPLPTSIYMPPPPPTSCLNTIFGRSARCSSSSRSGLHGYLTGSRYNRLVCYGSHFFNNVHVLVLKVFSATKHFTFFMQILFMSKVSIGPQL